MYSTKIINLEQAYSQADQAYFLDLTVEVYKDEAFFEVRKFGYPLNTGKNTILSDLKKLCVTLASDEEVGKQSAELEKQFENMEQLKKELL